MTQKEHESEIIQILNDAFLKIVKREGKIKKVSVLGNSIVIWFSNGNIYKQPLISKDCSQAVLD